MRAVAIGILAMLCGGCAARFDLVPRDPEAPWLAGQHVVRMESSCATVSAQYDDTCFDHLVFVIEVVNHTDSVLLVDPQRFTLTLASTGPAVPYELQQRFAAVDPATVQVGEGEPRLICGFVGPCRWVSTAVGPAEGTLRRVLRRAALEPGGSVRGEVWMPAWPLRRAIQYAHSRDAHLSIITAATYSPADYQVTVHMPRELGGQNVKFSVAAW
jgi:hypothetical protein